MCNINDFFYICTTSQEIYIELIFLYFVLKQVTYKNTNNTVNADMSVNSSSHNEKPKLDLSRYTKWFSLFADKSWMRLLTILLDIWTVLKFLYRLFTKHTIYHFHNHCLRKFSTRYALLLQVQYGNSVGDFSSCFVISFWTDNSLILQDETRRN